MPDKKIIHVTTRGLDECEEEFINESLEYMFEILQAFEAKKWKDFEFYCRYGYFEDDRYCSDDDEIDLDDSALTGSLDH